MNEEKSLHHEKGLPMSVVNSTKIFDDNEQDEYEREIRENGHESSIYVHNNNTDEMTRIPEITTEELQAAINKHKKNVNHQTATGYEPKTSKHATMRQEK